LIAVSSPRREICTSRGRINFVERQTTACSAWRCHLSGTLCRILATSNDLKPPIGT
jgi:hypothetical protein